MFGMYAVIFYIGAIFVRDTGLDMRDMFVSIFAIMFAAVGAGNNAAFMGDIGNAYNSARNLFKILDEIDEY